jgi:hypothetical protein
MTVPAQPSTNSASASQSSSSPASSASGQTPTFAHDTVTQGTSVTGLAGVYAERDAQDVALKIAQAVSRHVKDQNLKHMQDPACNKKIERIRVVADLSGLSDITTLRVLTAQADLLDQQITAYTKAVQAAYPPAAGGTAAGPAHAEIAPVLAVGAALNVLGVFTQMVAGTYTYSGQSIPAGSVGSLDILIANLVAKQPDTQTLPVRVDRFTVPLPEKSGILTRIQNLATQGWPAESGHRHGHLEGGGKGAGRHRLQRPAHRAGRREEDRAG